MEIKQTDHAILAPSSPAWIRADDEGLMKRLRAYYAKQVGTIVHETAEIYISSGEKIKKSEAKSVLKFVQLQNKIPKKVINVDQYVDAFVHHVNDAVSFGMRPEVVLYFSENCFGHADASVYDQKNNVLRIHDLKTGVTPASMEQLEIYAALWEFQNPQFKRPKIELRIYQGSEVNVLKPDQDTIDIIKNQIVHASGFIDFLRE